MEYTMTPETHSENARREQKTPQRIQIYFSPKLEGAEVLARDITQHLKKLKVKVESLSLLEEGKKRISLNKT